MLATSTAHGVVIEETLEGSYRHEIRPSDIRIRFVSADFWSVGEFGCHELEDSVARLILFFREIGYWRAFTFYEVFQFYKKNDWDPRRIDDRLYAPGSLYTSQVLGGELRVKECLLQFCMMDSHMDLVPAG